MKALAVFIGVAAVLSACFPTSSRAQTDPATAACKTELLVGVISHDGQLIRGLTSASFVATRKKAAIRVSAAEYDRSGRRIVLVVDRGSKMNDAAQALARTVIIRVLSGARPQDSFALITAGAEPIRVPFGTAPSDLLAKVNASNPPKHSSKKIGVLDAIAESIGWFQSPQRGDAMLVFSGDDDFNDSKAKFGKTLQTLQQQGIRVYAMLFGYIDMGTYYVFTDNLSRDTEDLNNLAYRSGGYLYVENTRNQLQQYKLDDDRTKQVSQNGWQLYGGIAETYVLQVDGSEDEVSSIRIELAPDVRGKVPGAVVVQSRNAAACQSVPTASDPGNSHHAKSPLHSLTGF